MKATIYIGDVLERLRELPDGSVDSIVTDPPYELGFMGKAWDNSGIAYLVPMWREALRVLKPGGHLLSFGGSRTYHRMVCAIEDAGFEIRDQIMWIYGSGFPKSLDVSKAIDKAARGVPQGGADPTSPNHGQFKGGCSEENPSGRGFGAGPGQFMKDGRKIIGVSHRGAGASPQKLENHSAGDTGIGILDGSGKTFYLTEPSTEAAKKWNGWGTALKPAHEPICVARKPLIGTVAENVQQHGTGALNIDGCRVDGPMDGVWGSSNKTVNPERTFVGSPDAANYQTKPHSAGRWPANVIHDGSEEVVILFPNEAGASGQVFKRNVDKSSAIYGAFDGTDDTSPGPFYDDTGSAARFFYTAKASKSEREQGLQGLQGLQQDPSRKPGNPGGDNPRNRGVHERLNHHPTVKPVDLMRYLVRLVTPPGGTVLDGFTGSGTTGIAALLECMDFIGIELNPAYAALAERRIYEAAPLLNKVVVVPQSLVPTSLSPCAPEVRP